MTTRADDLPAPVPHWRDFVCPFCYVGQSRSAILRGGGIEVVDLPFLIHPEIPPEGMRGPAGDTPRVDFIRREAAAAGLPMVWPEWLPNTALALAVSEWVRLRQPERALELDALIFAAHFAEGRDISDHDTLLDLAAGVGVDADAVRAAVADGTAAAEMQRAYDLGMQAGVSGTPAWLVDGRLVQGLQPVEVFTDIVTRHRSRVG